MNEKTFEEKQQRFLDLLDRAIDYHSIGRGNFVEAQPTILALIEVRNAYREAFGVK